MVIINVLMTTKTDHYTRKNAATLFSILLCFYVVENILYTETAAYTVHIDGGKKTNTYFNERCVRVYTYLRVTYSSSYVYAKMYVCGLICHIRTKTYIR